MQNKKYTALLQGREGQDHTSLSEAKRFYGKSTGQFLIKWFIKFQFWLILKIVILKHLYIFHYFCWKGIPAGVVSCGWQGPRHLAIFVAFPGALAGCWTKLRNIDCQHFCWFLNMQHQGATHLVISEILYKFSTENVSHPHLSTL